MSRKEQQHKPEGATQGQNGEAVELLYRLSTRDHPLQTVTDAAFVPCGIIFLPALRASTLRTHETRIFGDPTVGTHQQKCSPFLSAPITIRARLQLLYFLSGKAVLPLYPCRAVLQNIAMSSTNGVNGVPHQNPSLPAVYIVAAARTPVGSFLGYLTILRAAFPAH